MDGARIHRWGRVARAGLVASISVVVAAMSHLVAGGHAPGILGGAIALVFGTLAALLALGRTMTLPRLSLAVGVSQVLLHGLFSMNGSWGAPTIAHHEQFVASTAGSTVSDHSLGMLVAHIIAGVIAVLALRAAQLTVAEFSLLPWMPLLMALLDIRVVPLPKQRVPHATEQPRVALVAVLATVAPRRGPPAFAA